MELKNKGNILSDRIRATKKAKNAYLVLFDKFGTALRNTIDLVPELKPDTVVSERGQEGDFTLETGTKNIGSIHYLDFFEGKKGLFWKQLQDKNPLLLAWIRKKQFRDLGRTLCVDDSISNFVEDKTNLQYILEQSGVNKKLFSLRQKVFRRGEILPSLKDLETEFGLPFVVQGWSKGGDGTIIVRDETGFNKIGGLKGGIRISEFCNQQYSSIYGLIVPGQNGNCEVIMDRPSYKVVGIGDTGISPVFGGGCDWSRMPDIDGQETIENITKIGEFLFRKFGYIGAIMIEGFIINGHFVINEINSRLGGGNEVSGFNQIMNGELPIQALHYGIMLGIKCDDLFVKESFLEKHFYNRNGCFYIKIVGKGERKFKPGDIRDGLYKFEQDKIPNIGQIKGTNKANFRDGNFLITNSPGKNTTCAAKTHICMIESTSGREKPAIIGPNTVNNEIMQIAQLVYNTIQYE